MTYPEGPKRDLSDLQSKLSAYTGAAPPATSPLARPPACPAGVPPSGSRGVPTEREKRDILRCDRDPEGRPLRTKADYAMMAFNVAYRRNLKRKAEEARQAAREKTK